jgi:hypothetical protein
MRRGVLAAVVLALALSAAPALAATQKSVGAQAKQATWETVAGVFRTHRAAEAMIKRLDAKGLKGFTIKMERMGKSHSLRHVDERTFPTEKQAKDELRRMEAAGFHGRVVERRASAPWARGWPDLPPRPLPRPPRGSGESDDSSSTTSRAAPGPDQSWRKPSYVTWALVIGRVKQSPSVGMNSKVPVNRLPSNRPATTPLPLVDGSPKVKVKSLVIFWRPSAVGTEMLSMPVPSPPERQSSGSTVP